METNNKYPTQFRLRGSEPDDYLMKKIKAVFSFAIGVFFVSLMLFTVTGTASAADYYVATWGNNSNTGLSVDHAWKNPSYAVSKSNAGDTIYLVNGTWYNEHVVFANSGNASHPITLTAYNGTPVLDGVDKTGYGIYILDKSYINISNLAIQNYYYGIFTDSNLDKVTEIHINFVNISHTANSAVRFGNYASYSSLENSVVSDAGWNIISITGTFGDLTDPDGYTHHISIINTTLLPPFGHSGIDIFGEVKYLNIFDCILHGDGGIFTHETPGWYSNMSNFNISNNIIYGSTGNSLTMHVVDSVFYNNTLYDSANYGVYGGAYMDCLNLTFENNLIYNSGGSGFGIRGDNITYSNNHVYDSDDSDYRVNEGNGTVRDAMGESFDVMSGSGGKLVIEFTDGKVFTENGKETPRWYTDKSNYIAYGEFVRFTTYPMTARPTSDPATITVNKFDTSLPLGSILIDFTADTTDGNNVVFTVNDLPPGHNYLIKRDSVDFTLLQVNSSGSIQFSNSEWSEHTFTIEETSSGDNGNSGEPPSITEFFPANTSPVQNNGSTYEFNVNVNQPLTFSGWYLDDGLITSETLLLNHMWTHASTHNITFTGSNANGSISQIWTVTVTDASQMPSTVTITPSAQTITPNQPFTLTIPITPATPITGAQFNLLFNSSLATVNSVTEGDLLNQDGASTLFNSGTINNDAGTVTDVYSSILSETSVSSQGSLATISMTAGSITGYLNLNLTNIIISDANSNAALYTLTNATVLIDTAPVLDSIGARYVDEENTLAFTISAFDEDDNTLTYSATSLPDGASFNTASGAFSWTPADGQADTYVVTFEVTDGYLSDSEAVTITVNDGNHAPVLDSIGAKSVDEENALAFTVSAFDVDGDTLTYSATDLPDGASFNTASGAFSWTPADGDAGTYIVIFEVTDGYLSDPEAVTITVNEINHAPVITAFEPADGLVFDETDNIKIGLTASDVDGQALSYNIKVDGVTQSTDSSYTWETDYSNAGTHTIDITVSDGIDQVTDQHTITINNVQPRWDVNEDRTVNILDITMVGQKFGVSVNKPYPRYDVNQDGIVNIQDLTITGYRFGEAVA